MGCVNSDGSITDSARKMLTLLTNPLTAEEAALNSGLPLFRIRSSLREMAEAGLVMSSGGKYATTDLGRAHIVG